jgi:hypothetical protein
VPPRPANANEDNEDDSDDNHQQEEPIQEEPEQVEQENANRAVRFLPLQNNNPYIVERFIFDFQGKDDYKLYFLRMHECAFFVCCNCKKAFVIGMIVFVS